MGTTIAPTLSANPARRPGRPRGGLNPTDYAYARTATQLQVESGYLTNQYVPLPDVVGWTNISEAFDGNDTTATLTVTGLDPEKLTLAGRIGTEHFAHLLDYLHPDRRIRIGRKFNSATPDIYFTGYPMVNELAWNAGSQTMTCRCTSEADELLSSHPAAMVLGRHMRLDPLTAWDKDNPDTRLVRSLTTTFNAGLKPNRSAEPVTVTIGETDHEIYLFVADDAPKSKRWNVAEALRYLAYFYIANTKILRIDVARLFDDTNGLSGVPQSIANPFTQSMTTELEDLTVRGANAKEALWWVCQAVGLHMSLPIQTRRLSASPIPTGFDADGTTELRIFRSARDANEAANEPRARVHDLPREAPYTDDAGRTPSDVLAKNLAGFDASLAIDRRVISTPTFVGAPNRFEVTLLLRPGWLPFAQLDDVQGDAAIKAAENFWHDQFDLDIEWVVDDFGQTTGVPTSIYHGKHPDHKTVSDIGRLWIFPDTTRYHNGLNSPYARTSIWPDEFYSAYSQGIFGRTLVYQDAAIGGKIPFVRAAGWVPRPRPFFDTIGRRALSSGRSPIVHLSFDAPSDPKTALATATWVRYNGDVDIDATRAAIRFTDDNLLTSPNLQADPNELPTDRDPDMLSAYIRGTFMVAVTCTIEGDSRLTEVPTISLATMQRPRANILDVADRFRLDNRRGQNSFLNSQATDDDAYEDRDDTKALQWYALRWRQTMQRSPVAGPFVVPWIDRTYELGDSFSGVAGLGLTFPDYPTLTNRITTNSPDGQATRYVLTDLRQSPEVRLG